MINMADMFLGLQVALSPTSCSHIQIGPDGKSKWKYLRHHLDQNGTSIGDGKHVTDVDLLEADLYSRIYGCHCRVHNVLHGCSYERCLI